MLQFGCAILEISPRTGYVLSKDVFMCVFFCCIFVLLKKSKVRCIKNESDDKSSV